MKEKVALSFGCLFYSLNVALASTNLYLFVSVCWAAVHPEGTISLWRENGIKVSLCFFAAALMP